MHIYEHITHVSTVLLHVQHVGYGQIHKEYMCQIETMYNKEELLTVSPENYGEFRMINEHDRK